MTTKQKTLLVLTLLIALVLGYALSNTGGQTISNAPSKTLLAVTEDVFGGPFSLVDHNGKTVTDKDYADKFKLIYFGFTFCPAICPTELAKMTAALNALGEEAKKIQPLFITVDPERDTVEKMKPYVALFHPSLVGLTGTPEQIKNTTKAYKIYAAKVEDPSLSDYTVDHSSFIYLIAPDGRLLYIFKSSDDASVLERITRQWISQLQ